MSRNAWNQFDGLYRPGATVLESLKQLLSNLDERERDIVFRLLERYLIIREYSIHAIEIIKMLDREYSGEKIILSPVKSFGASRPKSGDALLYEIHTLRGMAERIKIEVADTPLSPKCYQDGWLHVSVDDFIGSGSQFLEMVRQIPENGRSPNIAAVCSIVIQRQAAELLESSGFRVHACVVREKAIGDPGGPFREDMEVAYEVYDNIESRLSCSNEYRRGYAMSEATVSMKSTPNNTLPIFWYNGRNKWPAPFPRP